MKRGHIMVLISCASLLAFSSAAFAKKKYCPYENIVLNQKIVQGDEKIGFSEEIFCEYCTNHYKLEKYHMKVMGFGKDIHEASYTTPKHIKKINKKTGVATIARNPMEEFFKGKGDNTNIAKLWLKNMNAKETEETCGNGIVDGKKWKLSGVGDFCLAGGIVVGHENQFFSAIPVKVDTNPKGVSCEPSKNVEFKEVPTIGTAASQGGTGQQQIDLEKLFGNMPNMGNIPNNIPQDSSASTASEQSIKEGAGEASIKSSAGAGETSKKTSEATVVPKKKTFMQKMKEKLLKTQ